MKKDAESKKRLEDEKASSSDEPEAGQSIEASESEPDEDADTTDEPKVGEAPGNLRQRERWFQQRTGGRRR